MPFLGDKLLIIRKKKRRNLDEFASDLGLSRPTYTKIEKNIREVDREEIYQFAKALDITEEELLSGVINEKHTPVKKVGVPEDISPERYVRDLQRLTDYQEKKIAELEKELAQFRRKG